jgi:tRNA 2-thiocytidine biosynthesis protein TtcA
MIAHGDRILVGLSGGKDSLALMWVLHERLFRVPIEYTLHAVYIDPGFKGGFAKGLEAYCRETGYPLRVERSDYGPISHSRVNRENPCFLCARLRRKRLFEIAHEIGCNKIALGHHKDDIIETLLMNMCYAGEISTMVPFQPFFDGKFVVIRPLGYTDEKLIQRFAGEKQFPNFHNPCPSATQSKRQEIKELLARLYQSNHKIKGNLFRSMGRVNLKYLLS